MARRLIGVGVLLVVLVALGVGTWVLLGKRAARAAQVAASSLAHCLLGAPLAQGEAAEHRLHRIAVAGPPADWPGRCDKYATGLADALERAGQKADAADVRGRFGKGFTLARFEQEPESLSIPGLTPGVDPAPDVPAAPTPATGADDRVPRLFESGGLAGTSSDPVPGAALHVIAGQSRLCSFTEGLDGAKCASLAKTAPIGAQDLVLWPPGDPGGSVWVSDHLQADNRVQRFFRADTGTLFDAKSPERAVYAHTHGADGFVTLEPSEDPAGGWRLSSWAGNKRGTPVELDLSFKRLALLSDRLVWVARGHDDDYDHLLSASLVLEPLGLGKPVDHGVVEVVPDTIEACRTKDALAVVLSRGSDARVVFFSDGAASEVKRVKLRADAKAGPRVLACSSAEVTLTRVVTTARKRTGADALGFVVQHARCSKAGCESSEVDLDAMLESAPDGSRPPGTRSGDVVATGLDGKLLVVWRSATRGIRARLAEPAALPTAPDQLVFDDGVSNGRRVLAGSVTALRLVSRHSAAVLLLELSAGRGVVGVRISPEGGVSAVAPQG
ncbi:MAG: hypothetical protein IT377_09000 [Polyangiaceae bacterium]|nr:hypothetical protein [Polyangiaceae bacterium]